MPYLVTAAMFVMEDDLDPIQVAKIAEHRAHETTGAAWVVHDLDSGRICVVDLSIPRIIESEVVQLTTQ